MSIVQRQDGSNDSLKWFAKKVITALMMEIEELNMMLASGTVDDSVPAHTMEQWSI